MVTHTVLVFGTHEATDAVGSAAEAVATIAVLNVEGAALEATIMGPEDADASTAELVGTAATAAAAVLVAADEAAPPVAAAARTLEMDVHAGFLERFSS